VKLRTVRNVYVNPDTTDSTTLLLISANNAVIPWTDDADIQPNLLSRWFDHYNHVCVLGSRLKVNVLNPTITHAVPGWYGVTLQSGPSATSTTWDIQDILENPRNSRYTQGGLVQVNGNMQVIRHRFSAKRFFGTRNILGNPIYRNSLASTTLAEQAYYRVWASPMRSGELTYNDPGPVNLLVQLDLICMFTEPLPSINPT